MGKLLKGIDICDVGTHNAGTTNTFRQLGLGPAIITAAYDLLKGLLAIYIAHLLGIDLPWILLAGMAAALTDSLSIFGIDDNFTVALICDGAMQAVKFFI